MNLTSGKNTSTYSDELFHDNDIRTNKISSVAIFGTAVIYVVQSLLDRSSGYNLGIGRLSWAIFATGILNFIVFLAAYRWKFDRPGLRNMLLTAVLLSCAVMFFFFPTNVSFLLYWPLLLSAMYYDINFVRRTAVKTFLVFSLALWGNVVLEEINPLIQSIHKTQEVRLWQLPDEVLLYRYIPHTAIFFISYLICAGVTDAGKKLVYRQAQISSEMASVESEMNTASKIQLSCLPDTEYSAAGGKLGIRAFMRPAETVGGDFYDYFSAGGNLVCLVADVSDKGLPAAMFMMSAKTALRAEISGGAPLDTAVFNVNNSLCRDNGENFFVTLFVASIDPETGAGSYVNCGHPYPIIKHSGGGVSRIENNSDIVLGVFQDTCFSARPLKLEAGDTLIMFTDGLTDAVNSKNEFFGVDALQSVVDKLPADCESFPRSIVSLVDSFAGGADQFDDMTLLAIRKSLS